MSMMATTLERSNPFSTRRVRPGAMPYLFPQGLGSDDLLRRLCWHGWWGQIVGPHGSGKSTLLETLAAPLGEAGRRIFRLTLHQGERALPRGWFDSLTWMEDTQLVIDGYEQLTWLARRRVQSACRRRRAGLLVTSHRSLGLPLLLTTDASLDDAQRIVRHLLQEDQLLVSPEEVATAYTQHAGNVREMLFALYDLVELRR